METHQIRLQNVEEIIRTRFQGKKVRLAEAINKNPVSIQRWFSPGDKGRRIGDKMARLIEQTINLPVGWIDNPHTETSDLEIDPKKKYILKAEHGDTHVVPLRYSATLSQKFQLSIIDNKKGKLMLLSTDGDAYAFQLIGHNPNPILTKKWGLVIEPGTPLTEDEYTIIYLKNGEILLRMFTYQDEEKLLVSHPVTGEQQEILHTQLDKALYCYIGIPPSKIMEDDMNTDTLTIEIDGNTYHADIIQDGHRWVIRYKDLCHKLEFSPSDSDPIRKMSAQDALWKHVNHLNGDKKSAEVASWKPCSGRYAAQ